MKTYKVTSQNRIKEFKIMKKNNNFSNIIFKNKKPQNELERNYIKTLNLILKELNIKGILSYEKEESRLLRSSQKFILKRKGWYIEINNMAYHFSVNENIGVENYINSNIRASLIWYIFGRHYYGNQLKETFSIVQKLRIDLLRMWSEKYRLSMRVKKLEKQIATVIPINGVHEKTRVNNFMKRKSQYKLC